MSQVTFEKNGQPRAGEAQDIGTTSEVVFAADNADVDGCAYFWLYNNSDTTIWVEYGDEAVVGECFPLLPGGQIIEDKYADIVTAIHEGSGNKSLIKKVV